MPALLLLLATTLPQPELAAFAARVSQAVTQLRAPAVSRVLLRVEDRTGGGNAEQLHRALRESLREQHIETSGEGESSIVVQAFLSERQGRPLAAARLSVEGREAAVIFAEFSSDRSQPLPTPSAAVIIHTRLLLASELPVLDLEVDAEGNLFLLHPDRLRVFDASKPGLPLKAEIGVDAGTDRLRDPLVRLIARESPRQLELYSAALSPPPAAPLPLEGYTLKSFGATAILRITHPSRAVTASIQPVAGRNYFRSSTIPEFQGLAPVLSPLRAHWAFLDGTGRVLLADGDLRPMPGAGAPGPFGSDLASVSLACAGTLLLAPGPEANPSRDRISVLRVENDRILPHTTLETEGAVRRLKSLPGGAGTGDARRVLAVAEIERAWRIEEIEVRCGQ